MCLMLLRKWAGAFWEQMTPVHFGKPYGCVAGDLLIHRKFVVHSAPLKWGISPFLFKNFTFVKDMNFLVF